MTLNFEGVTNKPYCMIMCATFKLKNGIEVSVSSDYVTFALSEIDEDDIKNLEIDENEGEFDPEELCKFNMSWKLCYIFDAEAGDDEILYYLTMEDTPEFKDAILHAFFLHEDAPDDYYARIAKVNPV